MKEIDVDDFKDNVASYLVGSDPVAVQRDGRTIGYYLPIPTHSAEERRQVVEEWRKVVEQIRSESGMSEEEFASLSDSDFPFPSDSEIETPARHAPGR